MRETAYLPDAVYLGERFVRGAAICVRDGVIQRVGPAPEDAEVVRLAGRAALPGLVNAHSHAFQRAIRGRTEHRSPGHETDDFWTWRQQMYQAAMRLSPEGVRDVSRMCFMEMALAGITTVGEFHYLHRAPDGSAYADPDLLAHAVLEAAAEVGLRVALLRVGYQRAGFGRPVNPLQARFIEPSVDAALASIERLRARCDGALRWVGVAPHSVRAVDARWLAAMGAHARENDLPLHMHASEQPGEVRECQAEHGTTPIGLLDSLGLLGPRFTAVHAVHLSPQDKQALASSGATVCACPTTERNLGDGIVDPSFSPMALGTDSQAQIAPLEDARQLEYHLRLQRLERAVLSPRAGDAGPSGLASRLFEAATSGGASSLGAGQGVLAPNESADFFTVDLSDPSVAGATDDTLLAAVVFGLERTAVRDVVVRGRRIVEDGRHPRQAEITQDFARAMRALWEAP